MRSFHWIKKFYSALSKLFCTRIIINWFLFSPSLVYQIYLPMRVQTFWDHLPWESIQRFCTSGFLRLLLILTFLVELCLIWDYLLQWFNDVSSTDITDKCEDVLNQLFHLHGCKVSPYHPLLPFVIYFRKLYA